MLLVQSAVCDIWTALVDIVESPPVGYGCQERSWIFVEPIVEAVLCEIGDNNDHKKRWPVIGYQGKNLACYSLHLEAVSLLCTVEILDNPYLLSTLQIIFIPGVLCDAERQANGDICRKTDGIITICGWEAA